MTLNIFIEDFERTENSDYLHGVLGRALIIATRFDSLCVDLSKAIDLEVMVLFRHLDEGIDSVIEKKIAEFKNLNQVIEKMKLPKKTSEILHSARESRNYVAHTLAKGLEGCVDSKIDNLFINEIRDLIGKITDGDIIVSVLTSEFYGEPILNTQNLLSYKDKVIDWVIKE